MPSVTAQASLLLPAVLRIMRGIDASGDVTGGRELLKSFGRANAPVYGKRAVQVAFVVARVRHARFLKEREELIRIQMFLHSLEQEGGDGPCAQS